jgi:glycosyltransferase involved in cell wall biosynthesis
MARQKLGWSESEVVLLFLSRIHPKKGLHLLLRALAGLTTDALQGLRLAIVGGGDEGYLRKLEAFARRHSSRLPRVDWVGEVWGDDRWPYFQGADLFCLTSYSENFGFAILEALQVGTRVLTTKGTPWDILPSIGAGTLVEPDEHVIRLALSQFIACPGWTNAQRSSLASKIRAQFSWNKVGPSYSRFYEELLAGSREMRVIV